MDLPLVSPVIADMYEAASKYTRGPTRNYLGMSSIGRPCARALWYVFRGYTPKEIEGRTKMIFSLGDRVEEEVVAWLERAGYEVLDRQRGFEDINGLFRGHWDGQIDGISSKPHVLEIKSANDKRFRAFQDSGIAKICPEYYAQVQCYMGYANLERALFVVMNKNDCSLYTEKIHYNRSDFESLKKKALRIITANTVPEKTEYNCQWCDFKTICTEGKSVQKTKTCGTCVHCTIKTDASVKCLKYEKQIKNWGLSCQEWQYRESW